MEDLFKSLDTYIRYGTDNETLDYIVKSYNDGMTLDMIEDTLTPNQMYLMELIKSGFYDAEQIGMIEDLHIKKCFQNYGIVNDVLKK